MTPDLLLTFLEKVAGSGFLALVLAIYAVIHQTRERQACNKQLAAVTLALQRLHGLVLDQLTDVPTLTDLMTDRRVPTNPQKVKPWKPRQS